MNWLRHHEFAARPLVAVEDHVYHISELLRTIQLSAPEVLANLTVVCLDRPGPDTDEAIAEWLGEYPSIQIASRIAELSQFAERVERLDVLDPEFFQRQSNYCRKIASFIRPQGLLLQDIELETLDFVPRQRWWETTILASTVKGIMGERPPKCAFISNKRGYEATFGAELLAAGHDPRDVLNKYEIDRVVVPFLTSHLHKHFRWKLHWLASETDSSGIGSCRVTQDPAERAFIESEIDIVLWPEKDDFFELGGRAFSENKKPIQLPVDGKEWETWHQLIDAKLNRRNGVEVQQVGARVAAPGALRAETTNVAARHIHSLRKRLNDPQSIVTVQGHYRIRNELKVGIVT